jgi:hypothetical protein
VSVGTAFTRQALTVGVSVLIMFGDENNVA